MSMLYEDRFVRALLAPSAATTGHILVQPQEPIKRLSDLSADESSHLFLVASYTAAILFQGLQAEGTNIIVDEAGERVTAHVIARRSGDGLSFVWAPQKLEEAAMADIQERIRTKAGAPVKTAQKPAAEPKEAPPVRESKPEPKPEKHDAPKEGKADGEKKEQKPGDDPLAAAEEHENYLVKQLIRIP